MDNKQHIETLKLMYDTYARNNEMISLLGNLTDLRGQAIKEKKALRAAITALKNDWVSVDVGMPEYADWYYAVVKKGEKSKVRLVFCSHNTHKTSSMYKSRGTGRMDWETSSMYETVTHWRPLPAPPEGAE